MLIRHDQMRLFGQTALEQFKRELVQRLAGFATELYALRGDGVFRQVVDDGVARAARYGLTQRGPVRFFVECMVAYGTEFDTDPQIPGLQECLLETNDNGQLWRAGRAFSVIEGYQLLTRGRHNDYAIAALSRLGPALENLTAFDDDNLEIEVVSMMARIHPEKTAFVGPERLRRLLAHARSEATSAGVAIPGGVALLCGLMFALGHAIARDPLYPWVRDTLTDPPVQDAALRVERLLRKTRMYLNATLKNLATLHTARHAQRLA